MTKAELVEKIQAAKANEMSRKQVSRLIDIIFDEIGGAVLDEGRFTYPGFGTFAVRRRRERVGRNPRTKELMKISATSTIGFRPAPEFKKRLGPAKPDWRDATPE
jgi:DNA-binding protein HU-beta